VLREAFSLKRSISKFEGHFHGALNTLQGSYPVVPKTLVAPNFLLITTPVAPRVTRQLPQPGTRSPYSPVTLQRLPCSGYPAAPTAGLPCSSCPVAVTLQLPQPGGYPAAPTARLPFPTDHGHVDGSFSVTYCFVGVQIKSFPGPLPWISNPVTL
jgi:hypothetical protein